MQLLEPISPGPTAPRQLKVPAAGVICRGYRSARALLEGLAAERSTGRAIRGGVALLALICGLGPGCSALVPHLKAPELKVMDVNFLGGDSHHQRLRIRIHVDNPNDRRIAVQSIDYQLALAGAPFAQGTSTEPFTVPASGQSEFTVDVNTDLGALVRVLGAHLGDSALDYQVTGTVHLAEGLLREIPFKGHGQLALH